MAKRPEAFGKNSRLSRVAPMGSARLTVAALLLAAIALAHSDVHALDPDDPPVWVYAKKCFDRVDLKNHRDLRGPFRCKDGERLPVTVNGHFGDIGICSGGHCLTDFPDETTQCDSPAWLPDAHQCYGNSYLSLWIPKSNDDVRVALLCRHKTRWTDNARKFDDVAMIVHNKKNGETCWFQSQLGDTIELDGEEVWGPAAVRSHLFWLPPKAAMQIGCIACHDSGPFVVSPWIRKAFKNTRFFDTGRGPFRNSEPPFNKWPEPRFVDIGRFGLTGSSKPCTACHKIAAGGGKFDSNGDGRVDRVDVDGPDRSWQTCETWIDWATTRQDLVRGINRTHESRPVYMPPFRIGRTDGFLMPGREWNRQYRTHVNQLKDCCERLGTNPRDTDRDCKFFVPNG